MRGALQGFFDPPFIFSPLTRWIFLIRCGIFIEGKVEVRPGLHPVTSVPGLEHLSLEAPVHEP